MTAAAIGRLFDQTLAVAEQSGRGVRLRLCFDRRDPRLAAVSELPWELLRRNEEKEDPFLALDPATPIVRHLSVLQPTRLQPPILPVRVLVVAASPAGLPPLAVADECRALEALAQERPDLELVTLEPASCSALQSALARRFDILHFMGHCRVHRETGEGCLVLDRHEGRLDLIGSRVLAQLLTGPARPRLVVLNACQTGESAAGAGRSSFGGLAAALVRAGVPAVVAMRLPITDRAAYRFSKAMYERLLAGELLEAAVAEGRRAIYAARPDSWEWATPALYLRLPEGRLFLRSEQETERTSHVIPALLPGSMTTVVKTTEVCGPADVVGIEGDPGEVQGQHIVDVTIRKAQGLSVTGIRRVGKERRDD